MTTQSRDWDTQFSQWAQPPSKTEEERCENAESMIRNAISASDSLRNRNIRIFTHGSYQNNTNVRKDSDVDVGILCKDTIFFGLPSGYTREDFNIGPATYHYAEFKRDVGQALVDYFGPDAVKRGNKAFDIHENSYHVEADVAPFFEYRKYSERGTYESGVQLLSDNSQTVINWPEQHHENGKDKNLNNGGRYKRVVRILKFLSNEMADGGSAFAEQTPGFLLECMCWNIPDQYFGADKISDDVRACLVWMYQNSKEVDQEADWTEVSRLKQLFSAEQKWTREGANRFIVEAWQHLGF